MEYPRWTKWNLISGFAFMHLGNFVLLYCASILFNDNTRITENKQGIQLLSLFDLGKKNKMTSGPFFENGTDKLTINVEKGAFQMKSALF